MLKKRFFGMMVFIAGIMLAINFFSCSPSNPLDGSWETEQKHIQYAFDGSNYEMYYNDRLNGSKGTFSLNSNKTEITFLSTHSFNIESLSEILCK